MKASHVVLCFSILYLGACGSKQDAKRVAQTNQEPVSQAISDSSTDKVNFLAPATQADQEAPASLSPPPAPSEKSAIPDRQFIRTADVKCRVDNVAKAVDRVEQITAQQAGFVILTKLDSQINDTETVAVSADSLLETTHYTVSNTMTLRVPNAHLDTTLRAITAMATFIDVREIKSDDVALQRLTADLTRRRNAAHDKRLQQAIDGRGRRLGETTAAEESRLNHQAETDEARINDLSLADQIQYSTVTLNLYQRPLTTCTLLPNGTDRRVYEPGFFTQAADALATGADILVVFILFLLKSWGIILFGIGVFAAATLGLRRWRLAKAGV